MGLSKLAISISLIGFVFIGFLLLTGHPGFAQKVALYTFMLIFLGVIYGTFFEKGR